MKEEEPFFDATVVLMPAMMKVNEKAKNLMKTDGADHGEHVLLSLVLEIPHPSHDRQM
eukprot:CAMPEP_0198153606 /NCGR_PEP_ID=MMETSP1443-20131203/64957_1 /TAXON_ID=186043 /ORGANISM="Entomoneis sp., Strain CCMP2396" /LENGTH=57 /DNA_ID=CAMNT_0043820005 /DNA_START=472 /DNA_END=642 /DNA_ORIENTATION=+